MHNKLHSGVYEAPFYVVAGFVGLTILSSLVLYNTAPNV